ncbi:MAG: hypothetical protein Q7T57_06845 [Dehalococcoidales bacterium]|nr:hypothetical protein [Dehalococcoidales bacterium]
MTAYVGLKFRIISIERIVNTRLEEQFFTAFRYFHQKGYHSDHPIRAVYHGTHQTNISLIVKDNLSMDKKGQLDSGWFGAGMYFSRHADYVMQYHTTGSFKREVG